MIMVDKRMLQTSVDIPAKRTRGSPIEVDDVNTSVGSSLSKGKSRAVPIGAQDPRLSGSPDLTMSEMAADIKRILVKLEKLETELQAYMQKDKVSTVSTNSSKVADQQTSSEASVQTAPLLVKQTGSLSSDAIIVAPTSSSEDKKEPTPSPTTRRTLPTVSLNCKVSRQLD
jgi:2-keto-4-pentenoate hydratase